MIAPILTTMIAKMLKCVLEYKSDIRVFFLAHAYFTKMTSKDMSLEDADIYAQVSLWIASKMEDIYPLSFKEVNTYFSKTLRLEEAKKIEGELLQKLDWNLNVKHTYWWAEMLLGKQCKPITTFLAIIAVIKLPDVPSEYIGLALKHFDEYGTIPSCKTLNLVIEKCINNTSCISPHGSKFYKKEIAAIKKMKRKAPIVLTCMVSKAQKVC
jgi:hypothetical protein